MVRLIIFFFLLLMHLKSFSQIRLTKLVLEKNQKFKIEKTDILVVDTLIMNDSSSIILNPLKRDNFIHAKETFVGNACSILGLGKNGTIGKAGESSTNQSAPCRNGGLGKDAEVGSHG